MKTTTPDQCRPTGPLPSTFALMRGVAGLGLAFVISLALVFASGGVVLAQEGSSNDTLTWSVRPTPTDANPDRPNFSYELNAGEVISDSIRVRNFGRDPLSLVIYASDALITESGALDLLPASETPVNVGSWVTLEAREIIIPAGEIMDIPFTVNVPANAEAGDHSGGIVTSFQSPASTGDDQAVFLDRRLGSRMHIRVKGELQPALAISEFKLQHLRPVNPLASSTLRVSYTVTNTGNVRLAANQKISLRGLAGIGSKEATLNPTPELLPGSSLSFSVDIPGVWPLMRTKATLELEPFPTRQDDLFKIDTITATAASTIWTIPWPQAGLAALLIGGPIIGRWRSRQRLAAENNRISEAVAKALAARDESSTPVS